MRSVWVERLDAVSLKYPSLSPFIYFILKSVLSEIRAEKTAFLLFLFA